MKLKPTAVFLMYAFMLFPVLPSAAEDLTITTYYPSPFGSYSELRAQHLAVGTTYVDSVVHPWHTGSGNCGANEICNADLVVEGNVGIGTINPQAALQVAGGFWVSYPPEPITYHLQLNPVVSPNTVDYRFQTVDYTGGTRDVLYFKSSTGNVGIGTTNPLTKLSILTTPGRGNIEFGDDSLGAYLQLYDRGTGVYRPFRIITGTTGSDGGYVYFGANGNVGIGTTNPGYKLETVGNIVNTAPSQGSLGLTGDLPGYAVNTYPTLKTDGSYIYFSAGNQYIGYWGPTAFAVYSGPSAYHLIYADKVANNVGIGTASPQKLAPNGASGNLDVNDVYIRSTGTWMSAASPAGGGIFGGTYEISAVGCVRPNPFPPGGCSCPSGFSAYLAFSSGSDLLYICYK